MLVIMRLNIKTCFLFLAAATSTPLAAAEPGNAIFIHPDGTGLGHWTAIRMHAVGPDGNLNFDRMDEMASYRPHQKNWLTTTSHAGATVHAYGKKVHYDSYGLDRTERLTSASGAPMGIMEEAMNAGVRVGIVNSGHIGEPGTGVFLAESEKRSYVTSIAVQILNSGADLIFCGGEIFCLPKGVVGKHGQAGVREDGRHLLKEAEENGYTVIYSRKELLSLPADTEKVIGIFAAVDTYNDRSEEDLKAAGLPLYDPDAPTFDELTQVALKILSADPEKRFFLVAEEEGTDNFSNKTNAGGMLEAGIRADRAIGHAIDLIETHPETILVVAADSDAGHPAVWGPRNPPADFKLDPVSETGAQMDGPKGSGGEPFVSPPDQFGNRHVFGIAWPISGDMPGSGVTKAHGYRSDLLTTSADNTDIFRILHAVLFGGKEE